MSRNPAGHDSAGRPHLPRQSDDRGSGTPELVIVIPVLMALLVLVVQLGLWGLASEAVTDAVSRGGAALGDAGGNPAAARRAVLDDLKALAPGLTVRPTISLSARVAGRGASGGLVSVEVSSAVPSVVGALLPGFKLVAAAESAAPDQRFRASG